MTGMFAVMIKRDVSNSRLLHSFKGNYPTTVVILLQVDRIGGLDKQS
jgi:hypothetical protein